MEHPTDETLVRFGRLQGTRAENREVVCHLLRRCPCCAEKLRAVLRPAAVAPEAYDEALAGVWEKLNRPFWRGPWAKLLPFEKPGWKPTPGEW